VSTLTYTAGRPNHDWEILLQNVLANGTFSPQGVAGASLTLTFGGIQLVMSGVNLLATGAQTVTSGTITGFSIINNGQTVLTMSGLTSANFADLQNMIVGSVGQEPYSETFKTLFAPFFTDEAVNATGSADDDSLLGSSGVDTLNGGGGDDYMRGNGGVDNLIGGAGRDVLDYRFDARTVGININLNANTVVNNNAGAAVVDIISGFEVVLGTAFDDVIRGNDADNALLGYAGSDTLYGMMGDNYFQGGAGADTFYGGTSNADGQWDKVSYEDDNGPQGIVVTYLGVGNISVVDTFGSNDTGFHIEEVKGSARADTFNGSADDDRAEGMGGNDTFNMGGGWDQVSYENERDAGTTRGVIVNMSLSAITANIGFGASIVQAGRALDTFGNTDTLVNVEQVQGTQYTDHLVGSALEDELKGGDGSDTLFGGAGSDNLRGDEGGNFNQGNDILYGDAGDDSFKGGAGYDYINGGADWDTVRYDLETTFTGDDATHGVIVNLSASALVGVSVTGIPLTNVAAGTAIDTRNYIDTLVDIERVEATDYNDIIVGSDNDNDLLGFGGIDILRGNGGNDYMFGGAGDDQMYGGTGDDFYFVDSAGDFVSETGGSGFDTIRTNLGSYTLGAAFDRLEAEGSSPFYGFGNATANDLIGDFGADGLYAGAGDDYLEGNDGADALAGGSGDDDAFGGNGADTLLLDGYSAAERPLNSGADYAEGGAGNDLLWGFGGNDTLYGGNDNDTLVGNDFSFTPAGSDSLYGGNGIDQLFVGNSGNAYLEGGAGNDSLFGGLLADTLNGGLGNDYMYGNAGADVFQFFRADFAAGDRDIVYFVNAGDHLRFSASLNGGLFFQNLASLEYSPGLFTTGVYITAFLAGGATATITVYGTTVAALTPMVEYVL
jgi:Ca2+-binding RTX toxin-like protein